MSQEEYEEIGSRIKTVEERMKERGIKTSKELILEIVNSIEKRWKANEDRVQIEFENIPEEMIHLYRKSFELYTDKGYIVEQCSINHGPTGFITSGIEIRIPRI